MSRRMIFDVAMNCSGCCAAVDRVLQKLEGVESYQVSLEKQKATIYTNPLFETVLEKIAETGKQVTSATIEGGPRMKPLRSSKSHASPRPLTGHCLCQVELDEGADDNSVTIDGELNIPLDSAAVDGESMRFSVSPVVTRHK